MYDKASSSRRARALQKAKFTCSPVGHCPSPQHRQKEGEATEGRFQARGHLKSETPAVKTAAPGPAGIKPLAVGQRPLRGEDPGRLQLSVLIQLQRAACSPQMQGQSVTWETSCPHTQRSAVGPQEEGLSSQPGTGTRPEGKRAHRHFLLSMNRD